MSIWIEMDSFLNYFQFISIRSCAKMPMLSTLCITGKLDSSGIFPSDHSRDGIDMC